jgi:hypothetical protein
MKIWNPNSEDYSPFFGQKKYFPIFIEQKGVLFWKSINIFENGKIVCAIDGRQIKIGKDENGVVGAQGFSVDDFYPWVAVKTNKGEYKVVCVRNNRRVCTYFLGFHIVKDGSKIGYMVCKEEQNTTFKGTLYPNYENLSWFLALSFIIIRNKIDSRNSG